ncbi:MAG: polyphosphate kinase 1 [Abditibacteriota bacterium]|nr:polyphosphate kinase 1 [Abditibacteriota bacterium]
MAAAENKRFITDNRDLSWLKFNDRVLEEAEDPSVPLLERMNFVTIYSTNFDEFLRVRIGKLHHQVINDTKGKAFEKPESPGCVLEKIYKKTAEAQRRADRDFHEIRRLLAEGDYPIKHLKPEELTEEDKACLNDYMRDALTPALEPVYLEKHEPFPFIGCKEIIAGCIFSGKKTARSVGLVRVPATLDRVVLLPAEKGMRFMLCEEAVLYMLPVIFGKWQIESSGLFSLLENADISESPALYPCEPSPRNVMEKILRRRDLQGPVAAKLYGPDSELLGEWLKKALWLDNGRLVRQSLPLSIKHAMDFRSRVSPEHSENMVNPPMPPVVPSWAEGSLIDRVLEEDRLLVYPYYDVDVFMRFLEEAAESPRVKAIKITLYRVAKDSRVIKALEKAAENGKDVLVLSELRARFDEARNVEVSKSLEKAGARVIYGIPEFKVHSKVLLIELGGSEEGRFVMQFGTGNYNERSARIYTDVCLLTADDTLAKDAREFFRSLEEQRFFERPQELLAAPISLKPAVMKMIWDETEKAKKGLPARIWLKMNSISDKDIIKKLSEASTAGVDVRLCVRGIACFIPGANGDTAELRSIVGRYLEHARVYLFGAGEDTKIYISSADFMTRNTEKRVEIAAPVKSGALKEKMTRLMELTFADNVKARILQPDGSYKKQEPGETRIISQNELFRL